MVKKISSLVAIAAFMCVFALPTQAQFGKKLGKLSKVTKAVENATGISVDDIAGDAMAATAANKIVEFMDQSNTVLDEKSEYTKRLGKLVGSKYTNVDGLALNYKVYENGEINILAAANGSIRVYSGMMDFLNDDELVATISTQIGHIANNDTRNALLKAASGDNAENAGSAQLEKLLSMSGDKMGTMVNELMQMPYTDDQNTAADKFAVELLTKNGSKTIGLTSALNKFAALEVEASKEESGDANALAAQKFIKVKANNAMRANLLD